MTSNKKTKIASPKVKLTPLAKRVESKAAESISKLSPKSASKTKKKTTVKQSETVLSVSFDWYESARNRFSIASKREIAGHYSAERFTRIGQE